MFRHDTQVRVRYAETDQMGYLYYGNYATYYEVGRAEAIRSLGLTYQDMEKSHGIMMPVVTLNMRFVRPAFYDQLITIRTEIRKMPDQFIYFHMELYNEQKKLLNGGLVKLCFVNMENGKRIKAPKYLVDRLFEFFKSDN